MKTIKCPSFFEQKEFEKMAPYLFREKPSKEQLCEIIKKECSDYHCVYDDKTKKLTHKYYIMRVDSRAFGQYDPCVIMLTETWHYEYASPTDWHRKVVNQELNYIIK